jgi:hypothetical protein
MKIGKRYLVSPIMIRFTNDWNIIGNDDNFFFVLKMGSFKMRAITSGSAGTMRTHSLNVQFERKDKKKELHLCWRPDVTHHYFIREPRGKAKQEAEHFLKTGGVTWT